MSAIRPPTLQELLDRLADLAQEANQRGTSAWRLVGIDEERTELLKQLREMQGSGMP
jgi:hypothetical protein